MQGEITTDQNNTDVTSLVKGSPTWWFDGDDVGWLPYDIESTQKLESAFQAFLCLDVDSTTTTEDQELRQEQHPSSRFVLLSRGRYSVDVQTMEQINTKSHFPRLVRRREN